MFERHTSPILDTALFVRRLLKSLSAGLAIIFISLATGMIGYHSLESMSWIDAFVNASMILAGMGPVAPLTTYSGKLFAGFYALYSGFALMTTAVIIIAPIAHRFLHRFHLQGGQNSQE